MSIKVGDVFVKIGFDSADFDKNLQGLGNKMNKVGKDLTMKVTAPLALFGGLAIKTAADFSSSMAKVNAVTGATGDEFTALNAQAKELGATTQFTATQVAEAMKFMGMAGQTTNEIMASLPATLNLAAAGTLDMSTAANISTNILAGFGMEVEDLGFAVDVLAKAFTSSNVDLVQLGDSMKYAGPVAKGFGMSFAETTAIMGSFGNAGIQGSLAGTSLRGAIVQLDKKAADFGITMRDTAGKMLPMADILEQLEKTGLTTSEAMELFGLRAGPAMVALLDTGSQALRDFTSELEGSGGTAEDIAKTQMEGLHGALIILKSAFESLQISITEILTPILTPLLEWATKAFREFDKLPGPIKTTAVVVGILAASIGPLLIAMSMMIKAYLSAKVAVIALQTKLIALRATLIATRIATVGMLGPLGIMVTLIGGAVATFLHFSNGTKSALEKVRDFRDELKKLNSKATTTKTRISDIEAEIKQLAENATPDAILKIKELQEVIEDLTEENEDLTKEIEDHNDELRNQKTNLEEVIKRFEEAKHQTKTNKDALYSFREQLLEVNLALSDEDEKLKRASLTIVNDYIGSIQESEREHQAYLDSIGQTEEGLASLEQQITDTTREQTIQNTALGIAQTRLDDATEKFNQATDAVAEFERKIADANRQINELSSPRLEGTQALEDSIFELDQQILPLERDLINAKRAMDIWNTEGLTDTALESARKHNQEEQEKVDLIQDSIDALREEQELLRINSEISLAPLSRSLTEAAEDAKNLNDELALSAVDKTLEDIKSLGESLSDEGELGKGLIEAKKQLDIETEAMALEQSIVDHFTTAVTKADEQLKWLEIQAGESSVQIANEAESAALAWANVAAEMAAAGAIVPPPLPSAVAPNVGSLPGNAKGGTIPEPTALFNLRTRRFYGTAGEAGSEQILPHGASGGMNGATLNLTVQIGEETVGNVLGKSLVDLIRQEQAIRF